MTGQLARLAAAVDAAATLWGEQPVEALAPGDLLAVNAKLAEAQRLLDSSRSQVAAEIARRSRPEFGPQGLAKKHGYRNPNALIAATSGSTSGDAARLVRVGEATAPRVTFSGEKAPARHPHVAAALADGRIGAHAASAIISMLDKVTLRAGAARIDHAERTLAEQAPGLTADQLSKLLLRAEGALDPDGMAEREEAMGSRQQARIYEDRDGMIVINGKWAPEHGAPIKVAVEAMVAADLAARQDSDPDAPRRTVPQMQADALTRLAEHALGCAKKDLPLRGAKVIVRVDETDLVAGTGMATIDGVAAPVSIATARRMAADGEVLAWVMGADGDILDWGRARRQFSNTQRLVLYERDGGCAGCGAPPSHTKAHHLRWWARDNGPTDLCNGLLLCDSCHHRIHDNGWEVRIEGRGVKAKVWFIPPASIDPARTPRLGGRARFDYVA